MEQRRDHAVRPERLAELAQRVDELMPQTLRELADLARIPSVSLPSFDDAQVQRSADAVAALLRTAGADVAIVREGGHPAVLGRVAGPPGSPTVLLYAHHDVQPPGEQSEWVSPPFEPTIRGGRCYGRGVADDKAGILAHLTALRAHGERPPVNVLLFIEGEEEAGSASLARILAAHAQALRCDVIVLADSTNWAVGTPALTTTLRGNVRVVVQTRALSHGLHSGMYGGALPDAITAMCRLLATVHAPDGSVAVAGLATDPDPVVDYEEAELRRQAGALPDVDLLGTGPLAARLWTRPAVTVIGIDAPSVDAAANLLAPTCRAKVSLRIAPTQDPDAAYAALEEHLLAHAPWGVQVSVTAEDRGAGFVAPTQGPYVEAARAAFADAWGVPPVDAGIGGSIPFIAEFADAFPDAAILVTGVEDPDTRAHGANESLHLGEFERVCLAEAVLLERLGKLTPGATP